jgi:hypothetical protein
LALAILHFGLVVTAFLVVLNGYLRGAKKAQIDATLSILWLILLGIAFVSFGWKVGALALVLSFIYALIARPIAASVARRILGYRTASESPGSFATALSVEGVLRGSEETERRLAQIARKRGIAEVLDENGLTAEGLKDHFDFLMRIGLGELAWEIVSSPKDLKLLLQLRQQELPPLEIASRLMQ